MRNILYNGGGAVHLKIIEHGFRIWSDKSNNNNL